MKKLVALLVAGLMVMSLVACGSSEEAAVEAEAEEAVEEAVAEGGTFDITYLTPSTESNFWTQVGTGMEQAIKDAEADLGVTINYNVVGPAGEQDTEEYITAFENAIAQAPDAIVTATLSIDPTVPKAKEATQAGIVLNFVNCGLGVGDDGANADCYNEFYFCSNDTIGEMAGQAFVDAATAKGITEGTIGINMNVENEALNHRIDAFKNYISENTKFEMTDTYYNGNDAEVAQQNAENIISSFGDKLIGMYSGNNITCDGVCQAIQGAGLDNFVAVGVDSDDIEIQALKDGYLDAIIVQDAFQQGYDCMMNAILTVVNGENPESAQAINCPPTIVTPDNIDSEEIQFMMDPKVK